MKVQPFFIIRRDSKTRQTDETVLCLRLLLLQRSKKVHVGMNRTIKSSFVLLLLLLLFEGGRKKLVFITQENRGFNIIQVEKTKNSLLLS